jgi:hypothetical protein
MPNVNRQLLDLLNTHHKCYHQKGIKIQCAHFPKWSFSLLQHFIICYASVSGLNLKVLYLHTHVTRWLRMLNSERLRVVYAELAVPACYWRYSSQDTRSPTGNRNVYFPQVGEAYYHLRITNSFMPYTVLGIPDGIWRRSISYRAEHLGRSLWGCEQDWSGSGSLSVAGVSEGFNLCLLLVTSFNTALPSA